MIFFVVVGDHQNNTRCFFSFNFVCSRVLNRTFNLTNNFATYLFVSWSESSYNIWLTVREDSTLLRAIVERCDSKERKRFFPKFE